MNDRGKTIFGAVFVIAIFVGALLFASHVQDNESVRSLITSFGPFGIIFVAFLSGLNFLIPIPATAFIPIFSAAGFALSTIIVLIVIGTTAADLVGYFVGTVLKPHVDKRKNKIYKIVKKWCEGKPFATQAIVFLYATFVPLPNELLLIPLGALGVKLRSLILAFVAGTTLHVTLLAFGLTSLI